MVAVRVIVMHLLLRKQGGEDRKKSERASRSRRRRQFTDIPNTDLYDSIEIDDSTPSNRNSGSSFIRRSMDFTRSTTYDNPAYRRSFELRPTSYRSSWYDPDAANYEYSLTNANLVTRKQTSPKWRSVSNSRLQETRGNANHEIGEQKRSNSKTSLHHYVPKIFHTGSDNVISRGTRVSVSPERQCHNGHLPAKIDNRHKSQSGRRNNCDSKPHDNGPAYSPSFRPSFRSRSYDPDLHSATEGRPTVEYFTVDNRKKKSKRNQRHDYESNNRFFTPSGYDRNYGYVNQFPDEFDRHGTFGLSSSDHTFHRNEPCVMVSRAPNGNIMTSMRSPSQRAPIKMADNVHDGRQVASVRPIRQDGVFMFQTKL
ncbi:uncharacterized protein LOC127873484 isoform X2 [Dreissena polymorpha]|uniref:uncharacterized protein LOC127873484 isoform X2 n=1 Tax=Dreissena polymorpha TaxID=45954 RepID=UPI002263DE10|nr:uncharacterized protein LOC127873484 isoform X2 [Dreissena polymorpha]